MFSVASTSVEEQLSLYVAAWTDAKSCLSILIQFPFSGQCDWLFSEMLLE
jgi:hypothetical protein